MQELIAISKMRFGRDTENSVCARDLWEKLEIRTRFADWIMRRVTGSQLIENIDFIIILKSEKNSGRPSKEYFLTVDAAKHIAMMEENEKGKEVRKYFIDVERSTRRQYLSSQQQTIAIEQQASGVLAGWMQAGELLGVPKHITQVEAVKATRTKTGIDYEPLLLASPEQNNILPNEEMLEPAELGKLLGLEGSKQKIGRKVNGFLEEIGWQVRENKSWKPTKEGTRHCQRHHWTMQGKSGYNYKWNVSQVKSAWAI